MLRVKWLPWVLLAVLVAPLCMAQQSKPPLTLDEFFNAVDIRSVKISPDGRGVVIAAVRPDWDHNRFRSDLWLYRETSAGHGSLVPLTQSGHDSSPEWSPDGRWIAFLSDRSMEAKAPNSESKGGDEDEEAKSEKAVAQVYVIAVDGGEAIPVTQGEEEVHAFAWSRDGNALYAATRVPWTKEHKEEYKKQWKDVVQFREAERGDQISIVELGGVLAATMGNAAGGANSSPANRALATTEYRVKQLAASPDGRSLAFLTDSRSERQEALDPYAIYQIELPGGATHLVSHSEAVLDEMRWAPDSHHVFFSFLNGSAEGKYEDAQPKVYWADTLAGGAGAAHSVVRWAASFPGAITGYSITPEGGLLAAGRMGTEVRVYLQSVIKGEFSKQEGLAGTYEHLSTAEHSPRVAFVYSSLQQAPVVYLADGPDKLSQARAITSFNRLFTERALPEGKPYRWTTDDGVTAEGMLIYPPGKSGASHLPMFTFIHGGPGDADGNHFEADWYQWAALAATNGWLVFEPNYRGSIGYGDKFTLGIIPHIVSRPGKDILEGIDALVKDGIADPDHLTVGGYSYGGYMTNWLITQTNRFKAAVTGAGAVEHVANWGNDDTTYDVAYFLGGLPWEAQKNYDAEAAIWQINKVRTPTHIVGGAEDIRVYVGEDYLLERALHTLGVPSSLLIFPGEGHDLSKNPWHGKIKVREELKWLEKYGR